MGYVQRSGGENPERINVIISRSGDQYFATVGTVDGIPREGEAYTFRTIEMTVPEALKLATTRSAGADVIVELDDDVEWDAAWGELNGP